MARHAAFSTCTLAGNKYIMNENFSNVIPLKGDKCPICGKLSVKDYHLFCSKRCAEIDLGRWLNEQYLFPILSTELNDDEYDD